MHKKERLRDARAGCQRVEDIWASVHAAVFDDRVILNISSNYLHTQANPIT